MCHLVGSSLQSWSRNHIRGKMMIKESTLQRVLAWLPAVAWAGLIFFLSAQPDETFEKLGLQGQLLSIGGHLVVYFVLMVLLVLALRYSSNLSSRQVYILAFLIVALYGLSDEYHQTFVPGRTATMADWFVDLIGAGLAWMILAYWERR
jgi:VanZ family protein